DGEKPGNDEACQKDGSRMSRPQRFGLRLRSEAHGGEFKEFTAQKVAVDEKEGGDIDARHQQQEQGDQIAQDHDSEELDRKYERLKGWQGLSLRIARIALALDGLGYVVEKEPGDDRRHRCDQKGKAEGEPDACEDSRNEAEPAHP